MTGSASATACVREDWVNDAMIPGAIRSAIRRGSKDFTVGVRVGPRPARASSRESSAEESDSRSLSCPVAVLPIGSGRDTAWSEGPGVCRGDVPANTACNPPTGAACGQSARAMPNNTAITNGAATRIASPIGFRAESVFDRKDIMTSVRADKKERVETIHHT